VPPPQAFAELKNRLARYSDLFKAVMVLSWDTQVMMPPAGAAIRAQQRATIDGLAHELLTSPDTARLLDDLRSYEDSLDPDSDDACLIRVAREDYEKAVRVPPELRREIVVAASEGFEHWYRAKESNDFESYVPHLERQYHLRRRYVDCFPDVEERYDALLDDFERGMKTSEVRALFDRVKEELVPFVRSLPDDDGADDQAVWEQPFPAEVQDRVSREVVELFGHRPDSWRLDTTKHPFASSGGIDDIRVTTRYEPTGLHSFFSTMHEYGHGLYEHQLDPSLQRTPLARGVSLGMHESQSRMWENLVGRSRPFWNFFYPRLQQHFPQQLGRVELETWYRLINRVTPSFIRIEADEVTYNLHVILRFELEQDLLEGRVETRDLSDVWDERMHDYLGVDVPDPSRGVLQDMHWGVGHIGYFSTYSLGNIISVQLWERIKEDIPDLEEGFERGEFAPLREWLGEHVHKHGRKFGPKGTLEKVVGGPIDPEPYLQYLSDKHGAAAPA
jgi:carboxypeptidase Taq